MILTYIDSHFTYLKKLICSNMLKKYHNLWYFFNMLLQINLCTVNSDKRAECDCSRHH